MRQLARFVVSFAIIRMMETTLRGHRAMLGTQKVSSPQWPQVKGSGTGQQWIR